MNNKIVTGLVPSQLRPQSMHREIQLASLKTSSRGLNVGNTLRDCHAVKVNFGSIVLVAKGPITWRVSARPLG